MTEYDKIEELLNGYRYIDTEIRGKELQIKNLDIRGVSIDDMPKSAKVVSSVELEVIKKDDLRQEIELLKNKKDSIENMLSILTKEEADFVELKYFKSLSYDEMRSKLGLSKGYLPSKKLYILEKLIPFATKHNLIQI
jgi:DNA-directed RNA polymerase specialized sigma24 family protein